MSINDNTATKLKWQNHAAPGGNLGEYVIATHPTANSVTLTGAALEVNSMIDKVVCIALNGICEYLNVLSNTADTLVFDSDVEYVDPVGKTLTILPTLVLLEQQLDTIVALDTRLGQLAVLLPKSKVFNERRYAHIYIELSGDYICPIVCRSTDTQGGEKSGYLQYRLEGVRLHSHTWNVDHWDIIQVYNVRRYATGYWYDTDSITAANFVDVESALIGESIQTDSTSRFAAITRGTIQGIQYTSLIPRKFSCKLNAVIEKSGSLGEATIGFAKYNYATSTFTLIDTYLSQTAFAGGDGLQTVSVMAPVDMWFGDQLYIVASKTAGTLGITTGSSIEVSEF